MQGDYVFLRVRVRNRPVKEFHDKEGRVFIEGRPGSKYDLEVRNVTGDRIMVALSVDGLSVMNGEEASINNHDGYIIEPYGVMVVPGWRLDNEDVAAFAFAGRKKSYAAKVGKPRNIGVIGCAVFVEKWKMPKKVFKSGGPPRGRRPKGPYPWSGDEVQVQWYEHEGPSEPSYCNIKAPSSTFSEISEGDTSSRSSGAASEVFVNNVGTEFGERTAHHVVDVSFDAEDAAREVLAIHYDDVRGLHRRGINTKEPKVRPLGNPFPATGCKPPSGWQG